MCRLLVFCAALLAGAQLLSAQPSAAGEDRTVAVAADVAAVTTFVETFVAQAVAILTNQ